MRKRRNFADNDNHGIIDLTSVGATNSKTRKRKMRPPGISNRTDYSYQDTIDSNNASIAFIGDSADHDAEYATNIFNNNARRYTPPDPEDSLDSRLEIDMGGKKYGMQGFYEETYFPQSNITTKRSIRWP